MEDENIVDRPININIVDQPINYRQMNGQLESLAVISSTGDWGSDCCSSDHCRSTEAVQL